MDGAVYASRRRIGAEYGGIVVSWSFGVGVGGANAADLRLAADCLVF